MKRITVFLLLCLSLILLGAVLNPSDVAIPAPTADESPDPAAAEAVQQQDPKSEPVAIDNPKLAVFWYAMADAQVFSFREQFGPVLEASGLPFREFDAENDRYRQLDQIRDAVSGGWNLLAVQLVDDRSTAEAEEIMELASGCPVIFFDRMPDSTLFADVLPAGCPNVGLVCTSPAELGSVQGKMIGNYLIDHFGTADLNQDGQIRYTFLVGDRYDPAALTLTQLALDSANAVLAGEGYRSACRRQQRRHGPRCPHCPAGLSLQSRGWNFRYHPTLRHRRNAGRPHRDQPRPDDWDGRSEHDGLCRCGARFDPRPLSRAACRVCFF